MDTWWANIKTTDLQVNDIRVVDFWRPQWWGFPQPRVVRSVGDNWDGLYVEGGRLTAGADVFSSFQRREKCSLWVFIEWFSVVERGKWKTNQGTRSFWKMNQRTRSSCKKWTRERGVHARNEPENEEFEGTEKWRWEWCVWHEKETRRTNEDPGAVLLLMLLEFWVDEEKHERLLEKTAAKKRGAREREKAWVCVYGE